MRLLGQDSSSVDYEEHKMCRWKREPDSVTRLSPKQHGSLQELV